MRGMPKFSLQRMLASTAIIALGCSVLMAAHSPYDKNASVSAAVQISLCYGSAALLGTGIGNFLSHPFAGAGLGLAILLIARTVF
jgi:F0F1-type ATP synthase assembly protein I